MAKLLMWAKTRNLYFWKGITENFKKVLSKWDALGNKGAISFGTPFGGINANGEQLVVNSHGQVGIDYTEMISGLNSPSSLSFNANLTISTNTTLNGDIFCSNLTINSGVTLSNNGTYSIICSGTFTNSGTLNVGRYGVFIQANTLIAGTINANGVNANSFASGVSSDGTAGANTLAAGGSGGTSSNINGGNGGTPSAPTLSNSVIQTWYGGGMVNYLYGGGGGADDAFDTPTNFPNSYAGSGGGGGYAAGNNSSFGVGGSGGGCILLVYGSGGYTSGTYDVNGGTGAGGNGGSGNGGNGGNGQVLTYQYSTVPITLGAIPASTNTSLFTLTYTSQYGKPIKIQISGHGLSSGVSIYAQNNSQTIGYGRVDSNGVFILDGFIGSSTAGNLYQITIWGDNTTTSEAQLYIDSAIVYEVSGA